MENARHIGWMWGLAVALGVGMGVASTPAVALAAPDDSGNGSSSDDSSPSTSPGHSGSTSSDTTSAESALSATNDARTDQRSLNQPGETAALTPSTETSSTGRSGTRATPETRDWGHLPPEGKGDDAPQRGGATSRPGSASTSAKSSPDPAVVDTPDADPTERDSSLDFTSAPVSSTAAAPAVAQPPSASMDIDPTPADPVSQIVTTLINAVLSPFASTTPTAPVQSPADFTLLAFARREFEPSTTVNPLAGQITNGLVTGTVASTSEDLSSAADPGFITSTHNFGLFSVTSAADPDDNNFVAFVFESPIFTFVLTSGADPEDNLGFGAASTGVAGHTVGTFISPLLDFSLAIPIEDPFAELFTDLVRAGF